MIENYKDLSDIQINNLLYFLDRSDTHRLNLLNKQFAVDKARKKEDYRQNVINSLSLGQLKLSDFFNWLSYVELEVNNNIFVYEAEEDLLSTKEEIEHLEQKLNRKIKNIYNIDSNHKSIEIINYEAFDNELIITVTVPAQIQVRNDITRQYELKNHIYLSYFVVDLNTNSIILMMHPTKEVASVNGIEKKRDLEAVSLSLLHYFKDNIFNFELKDPDWIHDALADISEEYFHHNNPIIEEQKNKFSNDLLDDLCKILNKFDPLLKKDDIQLRLRRGFEGIYEKELIELHKRVEKELSFTIFLQQSDRGSTQFRANTRKLSGQALSLKEAGDFIKLMWENGDIYNVGLIHSENEKEHAYIIKKEKNYFYLKKYTSSVTEREVVKNVLRKLNNYKPQSETSADTQETEEPRH